MRTTKTLQKGKKGIGVLLFVTFMLAGIVTPPVYATDLNLAFSFGPNPFIPAFSTSTTSRILTVPGHTFVSVSGSLNPLPQPAGGVVASVPVVIEIFKPEGGSAVASISTTALAVVSVPFVFALPPTFVSDVGCPRSWSVRVRTTSGAVPLVTVSGTITYSFFVPGAGLPNPLPATYNVDMEGPSIHLEGGGASTTPTLAAHDPVLAGIANRSLIQGTEGTFNIRAKWDTAFHVCYLNQIFPLNVALRKSDGTVAASQNRFSQTSSSTNKVNFNYVVTPADALLPGPWSLRVTDNNTVPCGFGTVPVAIDNFDVENLLPPSFQSTFTPRCSEAAGSGDLTPVDATVAVHERLNYTFSWTVPEGLNWHNLEFLQLRIRDDEKNNGSHRDKDEARKNDPEKSHPKPDTDENIISVVFEEPSNTFSLLNEKTDKRGPAFLAGSPNLLQTPRATLHLANTSVVASGPTSTTVTLNLALSFKPQAAGRTFVVEVGATDKGNEGVLPDFFNQVGTLTVEPKK